MSCLLHDNLICEVIYVEINRDNPNGSLMMWFQTKTAADPESKLSTLCPGDMHQADLWFWLHFYSIFQIEAAVGAFLVNFLQDLEIPLGSAA